MLKLYSYITILSFLILNISCKKAEIIYPKPIDTAMIGKIRTVIILGNSIVMYPPDPNIGWLGNWGLDASVQDNDFVHILIRNLQLKDNRIIVKYKNIADFEANAVSFPLSTVDTFRNADLIVMKIGENVNAAADPNYHQFISNYDKLLQYLDPSNKAVKLIVDGFWDHTLVNNDIRNYALSKQYPLISITDLSSVSKNKGLAGHPNDKCMRLIADRIWAYISNYF